ncbi:MAG TPA: hypothetical protein VKB79_19950 [Bryobacteraceae bacterium]|nr:hypothetical protein [Bryobacteraceae bacterium]
MLAAAKTEREHILMLLARNALTKQEGYEEILRYLKKDKPGQVFVDAFMDWSRSVLQRARKNSMRTATAPISAYCFGNANAT